MWIFIYINHVLNTSSDYNNISHDEALDENWEDFYSGFTDEDFDEEPENEEEPIPSQYI